MKISKLNLSEEDQALYNAEYQRLARARDEATAQNRKVLASNYRHQISALHAEYKSKEKETV